MISKPGQWRSLLRTARPILLWLAPLAFLGLFYFYPLERIFVLSFARRTAGGFSALWAQLTQPGLRQMIGFTFWQAGLSTLLTLTVGLPGAYLFARYQFRGKSLLQALTGIPFVLPTLVVAAAFNALLGPRGWVNLLLMEMLGLAQPPLRFVNSLSAILIAHVFYNTTIVLRIVGDFWSHLDPRLGQAARALGASGWGALRHVTLPLLLPAITAASLLVFIFDFTSFGVILVLGGPRFTTLEVEIYNQTISLFNLPLAAALSLVQLGCTLSLTVLYTRLSNRLTQPLNLRAARLTQRRLTGWQARLLAGIVVGYLMVLFITPLAALAARSFVRVGSGQGAEARPAISLTSAYYRELGRNPRGSLFYTPPTTAISVSLGYASATVLLALALGLPAAWALAYDQRALISRLLDPLLMLPLGTSAVTLGLGFIVALNRPPLDLRASPVLVPIAHTLVAFPFVVRSLAPAIRSISPRVRQAAAMLGAGHRQVLRYIDLPLVGRALLVSATFAFTISLGEFGATAIVARPEYPTIPLVIYRYLGQPGALPYGQAIALSTLLMLVTAGGILVIERLRLADIGEF